MSLISKITQLSQSKQGKSLMRQVQGRITGGGDRKRPSGRPRKKGR